MRLFDVLSKPPKKDFVQIEGFLLGKQCNIGQQIKLNAGSIALNYFCGKCDDIRTFYSIGVLTCICINQRLISIDSVLKCTCGANVQMWFLVESQNDINEIAPKVRIIRRSERLGRNIIRNSKKYGELAELLDKAETAYWNELGAGAIVYLRKIFEAITIKTANALGIDYNKYSGGNPKNFRELLLKVDERCSIIPKEFSENRYRLFQELSQVVNGECDELSELEKFEPLHRLVVGILENIGNKEEFQMAIKALGWVQEGV